MMAEKTLSQKAFRELAHAHGYDPAEMLVKRRMEISEVLSAIESGEINSSAFQTPRTNALEARLRRELYEIDRELLPYMHPKLSSQRVDLEVREKTLADYLREGADG